MKRKDQESGTRPFEETADNPPAPSSATELFSRSDMAAASPIDDRDEISQLLREPQGVAGTQPTEEKSPSPPSSPSPASQSVDLTGIFRKVKLDRAPDGSRSRVENHVSPAVSFEVSESEQGFTQMFQALSAASGKTTPAVESSVAGQEKAKQETINAGSEEKLPPLKWEEGPLLGNEASRQLQQGPQSLGQGEFTRLFQRLERNETASAEAGMGERPKASETTPEFGGFTQLLRTLSAEAEAAETPLQSAALAPVVPQHPSSGPGEFTRIISGSMLREAQGRTRTQQSGNGDAWQQQQTPVAASDPTPMLMPNFTPGMPPVMPAASPVMPMALQMVSQPQPPMMPMTPPVPSAPVPSLHVQPEAPAGGSLRRYIPLLLIANFFLMFLVLILVVFVLLHHH